MQTIQRPIVIGNWKMNPVASSEAKTLLTGYKSIAKKHPQVDIVACIPSVYIPLSAPSSARGLAQLGIQTAHFETSGAFTGEVSLPMYTQYGVNYIIVGHSERRALGETDEQVAQKVAAAIKSRVTPVVCVGELERDAQANFYQQIAVQVKTALSKLPKARVKDVVIAYEPVWAIGTGVTPTLDEVREMRLFIHKVLVETYSLSTAKATRVIYGGSVNPGNASILFTETQMNGFLVGGASLRVGDFEAIVKGVTN